MRLISYAAWKLKNPGGIAFFAEKHNIHRGGILEHTGLG